MQGHQYGNIKSPANAPGMKNKATARVPYSKRNIIKGPSAATPRKA